MSFFRKVAKALVRLAALVLATPFAAGYWLQVAFLGRDTALENWSEQLALFPGLLGNHLRRAFLRLTVAYCHPSASIGHGTRFSKAGVRIEANVYVGPRCEIALAHLGRDVLLSPGVHVTSGPHTHGTADPTRLIAEQEGAVTLVRIGAGAWIGSAAVVMADVGEATVVGAGAVVTRPLPARVVAVGVPARVVRSRDAAAVKPLGAGVIGP